MNNDKHAGTTIDYPTPRTLNLRAVKDLCIASGKCSMRFVRMEGQAAVYSDENGTEHQIKNVTCGIERPGLVEIEHTEFGPRVITHI